MLVLACCVGVACMYVSDGGVVVILVSCSGDLGCLLWVLC